MTIVNNCNIPDDLYYVVAKHVWARRDGDLVTVGMTDVASEPGQDHPRCDTEGAG